MVERFFYLIDLGVKIYASRPQTPFGPIAQTKTPPREGEMSLGVANRNQTGDWGATDPRVITTP